MHEIRHEASSIELAGEIDIYNDALRRHLSDAHAAAEPFELSDDDLSATTVEGIETQRAGLLSERLRLRQESVTLAGERLRLMESVQQELKKEAAEAEKNLQTVTKRTAAALKKAGSGPESHQAACHGRMELAKRQFDVAVRQALPVREAAAAAKRANKRKTSYSGEIANAEQEHSKAKENLRRFVLGQIEQRQDTGTTQTLRDPPRFATSAR